MQTKSQTLIDIFECSQLEFSIFPKPTNSLRSGKRPEVLSVPALRLNEWKWRDSADVSFSKLLQEQEQ